MAKQAGQRSVAALLADWSKAVRNLFGNKCVVCGSDKYVQAHHLLPKERYPELKLDLRNGIPLCAKHHRFGKFSAHRNGFWFTKMIESRFPTVYRWVMENMGTEGS